MHRKLFIPGPSEVIEENLQYLATPQVGHRLQEYKDLHGALIPKLKKMLLHRTGCASVHLFFDGSHGRGTTKSDCQESTDI